MMALQCLALTRCAPLGDRLRLWAGDMRPVDARRKLCSQGRHPSPEPSTGTAGRVSLDRGHKELAGRIVANVITHPHPYSRSIIHNHPRTVLTKTIADGLSQKKEMKRT